MNNQETDTRNYINEIAEKLWSGHAAAMVGTGFSMNAKPKFESDKRIPLWNDLGLIFMKKLGMQIDNTHCLFQDPIKLASEVSANFGENTLNQILIDSIPDMDYEPSDLHINFLKLNWADVFTTNYDTLLERASETINIKHYSLVTKDYDLVNAIRPRIVKLHGSFPSTVPFVITEEQYRAYPKTHAAFVNTVQQALVENILVLIGFSGTDPNFLNWIGWIRDNLGTKLTNKIYLISVDSISNAKTKLFNERNINVVDLSVFRNSERDDKNSLLSYFIDELLAKKKKDKLNWADNLSKIDFYNDKNINLQEIVKTLEFERMEYPGWIILPKNQRESLYYKTSALLSDQKKSKKLSNSEISIRFIFEFNWRWEKCLFPLYKNMQVLYEKVLGLDESQKTIKIELFERSVQEKAIEILLALYRSFREDANKQKCELYETILDTLIQKMSLSQKHRYTYEKILYASLLFNYKQFIEKIENWDVSDAAPIWQIKKAGLLAEVGKKQEALTILNSLLQKIRKQQGKKDIIDEYYLLSIENLTISLMSYVQDSLYFKDRQNYSFIDKSEFNERKSISKRYMCDIFEEISAFNFQSKQIKKEIENDNFDIENKLEKVYQEDNVLKEYSFLRFVEEIGYPFTIDNVTLDSDKITFSLKRIITYQPEWCLSLLMRTYRNKYAKTILARNVIQLFSFENITRIINSLIDVIYQFKNDFTFTNSNYIDFANKIAEPLFEIISRFCTKTDTETKRKICILLKVVINERLLSSPRILDSFIQRFIKSLAHSEKIRFLTIILEMKYPFDGGFLRNPCMYLNFYKETSLEGIEIENIDERIDDIISCIENSQTEDEKNWYIDALVSLFYAELLSDKHQEKLKSIIWKLPKDDNNIPILNHFRKFVITDLPHDDSINLQERYEKCMINTSIMILSDSHRFGYDYPWYEVTAGLSKPDYYTDEYCINIVNQMKKSWEKDSKYLNKKDDDPFFSEKDFIQTTYRLSAEIICKIILYRSKDLLNETHKLHGILSLIIELLNNYKNNDIQCLSALIASTVFFPDLKNEYLKLIEINIISNTRQKVIDALNAITFIFNHSEIEFEPDEYKKIINLLADSILWQSKGDFVDCLKTFSLFLRKNEDYDFDESVFEKILIGLRNVRVSLYETNSSLEEEITIKAACAELANSLFNYYNNKNTTIPDEVVEWQKICTNLEDFVEIRNPWICESNSEDDKRAK